jgi:hypothetical protein
LYGLWPITRTYLGNGVALAIATSGTISEPKPELVIILLYTVVATIVSVPYQKWRVRAAGAVPQIETGGKA